MPYANELYTNYAYSYDTILADGSTECVKIWQLPNEVFLEKFQQSQNQSVGSCSFVLKVDKE